jgi:uncharacterized protein
MDDRAVVARQLGRQPRAFRRVVVYCPHGMPAVTEQAPYDVNGEPFPTTYYLTCSYLVTALARIEAAGGVDRWSRAAADDPTLAASLAAATEDQRHVRHELAGTAGESDGGASLDLGIGGASSRAHLKCLHAHAAYALARPGYVLGQRVLTEVQPPWPVVGCCSEVRKGPTI